MIAAAGCVQTRPARRGMPAEFDCPDTASKVRLLDAAAWAEARYDRRLRPIAVKIASQSPSTDPLALARAIHRAVKCRVRYLGEGIEAFQPACQTWSTGLGDCDDSARLIVALARSLDLAAGFVVMGDPAGVQHICAMILGRWADATLDARFGEHPIAAFRRLRAAGRPTRNFTRPNTCYPSEFVPDEDDASERARRLAYKKPFHKRVDHRPVREARSARHVKRVSARRSSSFAGMSGEGFGGVDESRVETRAILSAAWDAGSGFPPKTAAALQAAQAIAKFEGAGGEGCWNRCPGVCHNWGAIQMRGSPIVQGDIQPDNCPDGSAPCTDTHPDGTKYGVCFKTYASREEGGTDYLQTLLIQFGIGPVIGSGDADLIATQMIRNHYAGSHGATEAERIANYAVAIASNAAEVGQSLGEGALVTRGGGAGGASSGASSGSSSPPGGVSTAIGAAAGVALVWAAFRMWRARR